MVTDEGEITLFGNTPSNETGTIKNSIGYMPQQCGLYEDLMVIENRELYADLKWLAEQTQKNLFEELLNLIDPQIFPSDRPAA